MWYPVPNLSRRISSWTSMTFMTRSKLPGVSCPERMDPERIYQILALNGFQATLIACDDPLKLSGTCKNHFRTYLYHIYTIFIPYLYHIYTWWGMDGSYLYHFIPWKSYGFDPSRGVFDRDIFEADKFHAASATDPGKAKDMLRLGNMPWWETEQAIIRWSFGKMPYRTSSWGCFICFTSQWKSWGLVVTVQWRTST